MAPRSSTVALTTRAVLVALVTMTLLLVPAAMLAQASPTPVETPRPVPSAPPMIGSGDSRSEGEGPGLVGSPVAIAVGVVVLGVLTAVGTMVVLRIGGPRRGE